LRAGGILLRRPWDLDTGSSAASLLMSSATAGWPPAPGRATLERWTYGDAATRIYRFDGKRPARLIWNALGDGKVTADVAANRILMCDPYGAKLATRPVSGKVKMRAGVEPAHLIPAG